MYTIIIPSCNRLNSLLALLANISAQTLLPSKIFLILQSYSHRDIDRVEECVSKFSLSDITELLIYSEPYGLARCRVLVLHRVRTPFFAFLDDDISIATTFFESSTSFHNSHPNILACSGFLKSVKTNPLSSKILNFLLPYTDLRRRYFSRLNTNPGSSLFGYTDVISGGLTTWKTSCIQSALPIPSKYYNYHYFEDVFFSLYFSRSYPSMRYAILPTLPAYHTDACPNQSSYLRSARLAGELTSLINHFYPRFIIYIPLIYAFYFLSYCSDFARKLLANGSVSSKP